MDGRGGRAVIACWVIYLVILADRPRARARCEPVASNPLPAAQPPALVEIKNSLYYTSHSAPPVSLPPLRRHPPARSATLRPLLPSTLLYGSLLLSLSLPLSLPLFSSPLSLPSSSSCHLTRPLPSSFRPPPSTHHIPPLWRRLVRADRLNMRPAIPDGTNIIKVRPHAKPVKYRRPPPLAGPPGCPLADLSVPRRRVCAFSVRPFLSPALLIVRSIRQT